MNSISTIGTACVIAALLLGCPPVEPAGDAGRGDRVDVDAAPSDEGTAQDVDRHLDARLPDLGLDGGIAGPFGFSTYPIASHQLTCEGGLEEFDDVGYVCTLDHGALAAHIYVHAIPVGTVTYMNCLPETYVAYGWISIAGEVNEVTAAYSYGGGHANNWLEVAHDGRSYRFYHSSFGWGWRACHEPDCIQVYQDGALIDDGCTPERLLPAICVQVQPDGSVPELVDTFAQCPGDPNVDGGP